MKVEPKGFEVLDPRVPAPTRLQSLPYVRLFPETPGRLPPGAWKFYNRALGRHVAVSLILCPLGLVGFVAVLVGWLVGGSLHWQIGLLALSLGVGCGWHILQSIKELRRLCPVLVVAPAVMKKVGRSLGANDVVVTFEFTLFGNLRQHSAEVPKTKRLKENDSTYLAIDPTSNPIRCFHLHGMCESAWLKALAEAPPETPWQPARVEAVQLASSDATGAASCENAQGDSAIPVGGIWIEATFTLTQEESAEFTASVEAVSAEVEAKSNDLGKWLAYLVLFCGVAVVGAVVLIDEQGPSALLGYPLRNAGTVPVFAMLSVYVLALGYSVRINRRSAIPPVLLSDQFRFCCNETTVQLKSTFRNATFSWEAFFRFSETPTLFVLVDDRNSGVPVAKRALPDRPTLDALRERIQRHAARRPQSEGKP